MKNLLLILCLFASVFVQAQDSTVYNRVPYDPIAIVINIPDVVVSQTKLKRTATLFTMVYNQYRKTLSLKWTVKYFADSVGNYGAYLGGIKGTISDYNKEIIADNTTFVNPTNGAFLIADSTGKYSMNYMGQYDFFNAYAENYPIKVHDLIRQYGNQITNWDK